MVQTRGAKRRRLADSVRLDAAAEPIAHGGAGVASFCATFFRTLPADALAVVLRHLSMRPMHARWQAHVSPWEVALGCAQGHPLRFAIRSYMTAMHAHNFYELPPGQEAVGMQLSRLEQDSLFNDVLAAQAVCLSTLSVDALQKYSAMSGAPFVHCTALRVLALGCYHNRLDIAPLLRACGAVLRELHMTGVVHLPQWHVNAVARYCGALTALTLHHVATDTTLEPLWRAVGPRLTRLAVRPPLPTYDGKFAEELAAIAAHCTMLEDLELVHNGRKLIAIPLLEALGAQLHVLRLTESCGCPPPDVMRRVIELCPNARLHLNVRQNAVDLLRLAGGRLCEAKIGHFNFDESFRPVADSLQHLEQCSVRMVSHKWPIIEHLFASPKRNLRRLELNRTILSDVARTNLLDIVAGGTFSLRELKCITKEPLTGAHVDKLLKANRELHSLCITNELRNSASKSTQRAVERSAASLIERIVDTKVNELLVLDLHCKKVVPLIEDACLPLRFRGVDVVVGSVRYIPTALNVMQN